MGQVNRPPTPGSRLVALLLGWLAVAVVAGSWRYLTGGASLGDDDSSHLAEILTIARALKDGRTDFWFSGNLLGYPLFMAYQPAPSLVMGVVAALTQSWLDPFLLYKISVVALWSLTPTLWYLGGRSLGLNRAEALLFGALALAVRDVWDFGIGLNSSWHYGLYTQVWAMALLPLTLGALARTSTGKRGSLFGTVSLLAATTLCHTMAGLLCGLASLALVFLRRRGIGTRMVQLAKVWTLASLLMGFWLLPFFINYRYQGGFPWTWETTNGFTPPEAMHRTIRGDLMDGPRIPWLTTLAALGTVLALRRRWFLRDRWPLLCVTIFFLLWLGPATWGPMYRHLPVHREMQVVRYVMGIQIVGLLFAARGLTFLLLAAERAGARLRMSRATSTAAALVLACAAFVAHCVTTMDGSLRTFDYRSEDFSALARAVKTCPGRFLCHQSFGTATPAYTNLLPLLSDTPQLRTSGRGYHDTLSMYYIDVLQLTPEDFRLYNVQALVTCVPPPTLPPGWKRTFRHGAYAVYRSPDPAGYFEFIHVPLTVCAPDLKALRPLLREIDPVLYAWKALPLIRATSGGDEDRVETIREDQHDLVLGGAIAARRAGTSQIKYELLRRLREGPAPGGVVRSESRGPTEYRCRASSRSADEVLLLKASFHPYWTASVDQVDSPVLHVAPNLMGVRIPPGDHDVTFRYRNPLFQKLWFAGSLMAWLGALARRWATGRMRPR